MKFIFAILALAASAYAQSVSIASPSSGQNVNAGQGATVVIQKGVSHDNFSNAFELAC